MAIKRGYVYPDHQEVCSECGRSFKTVQALQGHRRFVHREWNPPPAPVPQVAAQPEPGNPDGDPQPAGELAELRAQNSQLAEEVRTLRLLKERQNLSGFGPAKAQAADVASASGLGDLDPEIKARLQSRALNLDGEKTESWLVSLLKNPEGLKIAADALRGILGVQSGRDGQLSDTLKLLGCDSLLQLAEKLAGSNRAPSGLKLAGLDLSGISLSPEIFAALLQYQGVQEQIAADKDKNNMLAQGMESLTKLISTSGVLNRIGGGGVGTKPATDDYLPCPNCGAPLPAAGLVPGGSIVCSSCGKEARVEAGASPSSEPTPEPAPAPEAKPKRAKVPKPPPPEPQEIIRCQCGQALDITGMPDGATVVCGACKKSVVITNPDKPLAPIIPRAEDTLLSRNQR